MIKSAAAIGVAVLLVWGTVAGQEGDKAKREHTILTADDVKWVDAPPSIPPGAKAAILDGDPKKEGVFTMRLKLPAGYKLPPHWHPGDERVTVISGCFELGLGEKFDTSKAKKLSVGSYFSLPPKTPHFALVSEETVVQLSTLGPWSLTYVNPDDDPRKGR